MADASLADLTLEEFRRVTSAAAKEPRQPAQLDATQLTPDIAQALDKGMRATAVRPDANYVSPEGQQMGIRPEAFLDIDSGAPAATRARMSLDKNALNQHKLLGEIYGMDRVDLSPEGRFIIRGEGPNGPDPKTDLMVDPYGIDAGDIVGEGAGEVAPIVAGAAAARFLGPKAGQSTQKLIKSGVGRVIAASVGMGAAQQFAGGLQDSFVRWLEENDVNLPEVGKRRAWMAAQDAMFGTLLAAGAKTTATALEGMSGFLQLRAVPETAVEKTARHLFDTTGVDYKLTPGQISQSPLLMRLEAYASGKPGSASAMDRYRQFQQQAEDELRRVYHGLPRTMSDEALAGILPHTELVGQRTMRRLRRESDKLEADVDAAATDIKATGTREAQQRAGVDLQNPLNPFDVGKALRDRAVADFDTGHSALGQRYEQFLAQPEIQARTAIGDDIAAAATAVEDKFVPKRERTVATQSPVVGPNGQPIVNYINQEEPLTAFIEGKFQRYLNELKGMAGARTSVRDLKTIRTELRNAVKEGIAIPGTDVARLRALEDTVDTAITDSLKGMADPRFLKEWDKLRGDYHSFQSRFDREGIRQMLVKEGETGSIGNTRLAESVMGRSAEANDRYQAFKTFFGGTSPEFTQLQRAVVEDAILGAFDTQTRYITGEKLLSRLDNMRGEIASDVLGVTEAELRDIGVLLKRARGKIDTDELANVIQGRTLTSGKLQTLIDAESKRATAYNNDLLRRAAKDPGSAGRVDPADVVRYAFQMNADDARKMVALWSSEPGLLQSIRQLGVEDLWSKARSWGKGGVITASALDKALGEPAQRRAWEVWLSPETVKGLESLVKLAEPREFAARTYKGGGQLAGAADINQIFMQGEVGAMSEAVSNFLVGILYSGPLKRVVTNLATPADRSRLLNAVIASTPFIESLTSRFGTDGSAEAMKDLRSRIEPIQKREMFIRNDVEGDPSELSLDEFKRWMKNAKAETTP